MLHRDKVILGLSNVCSRCGSLVCERMVEHVLVQGVGKRKTDLGLTLIFSQVSGQKNSTSFITCFKHIITALQSVMVLYLVLQSKYPVFWDQKVV